MKETDLCSISRSDVERLQKETSQLRDFLPRVLSKPFLEAPGRVCDLEDGTGNHTVAIFIYIQ